MTAAECINEYILKNGITKTHVSKITGISKEAMTNTLNGKRVLKADEFISICKALNLDLKDFYKTA